MQPSVQPVAPRCQLRSLTCLVLFPSEFRDEVWQKVTFGGVQGWGLPRAERGDFHERFD